jgi:hypothetical protein
MLRFSVAIQIIAAIHLRDESAYASLESGGWRMVEKNQKAEI